MELNATIEEDIRRLNDATFLPEKKYEQLIEKLFTVLSSTDVDVQLPSSFDKRLVASLLTFVFECIRYDLDESSIRSKLDDLQLTTKSRQDRLLAEIQKHRSVLQLHLKQNCLEHDRLLNVNWRLDLQLKTNHTDKLHEPLYILDWTKREKYTSTIDHVQMTCSQESLQELVEKLKDAQSVLHQMQYQHQAKK